jgi:predicted O-methyltransferase YrrM
VAVLLTAGRGLSRYVLAMRLASQLAAFARLPRPAQTFYLRAALTAIRAGDQWSLKIAVRPRELEKLLQLSGGGPVAEIGTGTGWCALALAACGCQVVTCDRIEPPQRERYIALVAPEAVHRIRFSKRRGEQGPAEDMSFPLLFVDASHIRDETIATFEAWEPAVAPGGAVAFHDYAPAWPGVVEAVDALGLEGETCGVLFVWRKTGETKNGPEEPTTQA